MRTLYYVPIIHTSADMGSLARAVTERGIRQVGERNWIRHVNAVHRFWDAIAAFCAALPAANLKIYQDGLVAEGEIGAKIVAAAAESGSRNYEIVRDLMRRGARIVKTEDFKLVLEERDRILALVNAPNARAKIAAFLKYRWIKNRLLNRRDAFVARRIADTLADGETGILFVGACHRIKARLPKDIKVIEVKEARKVRRYQELLPFCHRRQRRCAALGRYLAEPVEWEQDNSTPKGCNLKTQGCTLGDDVAGRWPAGERDAVGVRQDSHPEGVQPENPGFHPGR